MNDHLAWGRTQRHLASWVQQMSVPPLLPEVRDRMRRYILESFYGDTSKADPTVEAIAREAAVNVDQEPTHSSSQVMSAPTAPDTLPPL